jgi:hypothetical protein
LQGLLAVAAAGALPPLRVVQEALALGAVEPGV